MSASLDLHRREAARLAELERLGAVGPEADRVLQELVDDAREAFGTELCMANLITSEVQYFTAWSGDMPEELAEAGQDPRERSMCRYVVETEQPFVVEDLLATERFKDQHFRVRYGVRFYAGTPLITADGHAVGSLCLLDTRPREFGERDIATLRAFARAVVGRLEALAAMARERDAKESERRYRRNIFELANDAILIFDPETGIILDANERACETYRLPRERLVEENVEALPLDPERDRQYVRELLSTGSCRDYETGHRRGDGTPMDVSINSSVIEYGGRRAVLSINRDITERKRAEDELRRSEARSRAILDASPDSMFLYGRDGEYLDVQANKAGKLYLPGKELIGRKLGDVLPPEVAQPFLQEIARALDTQETQVLEYQLEVPEGVLDFEAYLVASGPDEVLCVARDVTERKRAEERLREAEERYRILVEQIPAVTYVDRATDGPDEPLYTSPQIGELLGYTPQEWLEGRLWPERLHPDDRERVLAADERFEAGDEPFSEEYRLIAKDGRVVWVREEAAVVRGEGGEPLYWQGILLDVTDRKESEERLREAEEKYRTLVERIPAVVYTQEVEHNNVVSYVGPQIEALLGYRVQEYASTPKLWLERIHPDDRERVLAEDERTDETGEPFRMEYRKIARDGRVVWVRDEAVLVGDSAGRPRFWQGVMTDVTERKEAEERLRFQAQLLDAVGQAVVAIDLEGRIVYWNRAAEGLYGWAAEEAVGRPAQEVIVSEDQLERAGEIWAELTVGGSWSGEFVARRRDGMLLPVMVTDTPVFDKRGDLVGIIGVSADIAERKRAEEALRESEERFRAAFENAPTGVALVGLDNRYLRANRALCEMLGYEEGELIGKSTFELTHPEDLARSRSRTGRILEEGGPESEMLEKRYVRRDGSVMWALSSVSLIRDSVGNPEHLVSLFQDVTERKRAERALGQSEERYRSVVENVKEAIFQTDAGGRWDFLNPAWEEMTGFPVEESLGEDSLDYVHPEDRERNLEEFRTLVEGEKDHCRHEVRYLTKGGGFRWVEVYARLTVTPDGTVLGTSGTLNDVTDRRRAEDELRRSEARNRAILDASPDLMFLFGRDGGYLDVQANEAGKLYLPPEEFIGRKLDDVLPPEVAQASLQKIARALDTQETQVLEYQLEVPEGVLDFEAYLAASGPDEVLCVARDVTERKRAEGRLREAEDRYRTLVEQAPAIVYVDTLEGPGYGGYTSPQAEAILGYPMDEWDADPLFWTKLVHPADRERVVAENERANALGEPLVSEYRMVCRDGRVVWLRDHSVVLHDGEGRPWRRQGIMLDATEQKRAEEALRASEANLTAAQRISHLGSWEIDLVAGKMSWSDEFYRIFGFAPGEVTPTRELLTTSTHPQDRELVPEAIRDAVEKRQPFDFEHRVVRPDGKVRVVQAQGEAVFDPDGRPVKLVGTSLDITERKRIEEALRVSEARLRTVIEQSPLGIHIFALDGTTLLANDAWDELWYLDDEESPEGTNVFEDEMLHAAGLIEHVECGVDGAAVETPPLLFDPASVGREGAPRWLKALIYPVRGEDGRLREVALLLEDVTERREAEKKLREAERRYRTLVERIPAVTYVQEAKDSKAVTYVSPQMETMLGYAPEECTSDPDHWIKILHPDDKERVFAEDERTDETGEPFRLEYRQLAKDGRTVWVRDEAALVRDEEGNPSYWLGVQVDVTQRKRAEEDLRESEERLRKLADAAFEGIIIHDGREILEANEAYAAMNGREVSEIVGTPALERVALEYRALVRQHVLSGYEEPFESVEIKKDGTRIDVEIRAKALSYRGRTVRVAAVRDITERKRAEAALRESEERHRRQAKELELLHQVRTALAQELEPPAVFCTVVEAIARTYGYTQVSAYRLRGETLVLEHQVGYERTLDRIPVTQGVMGRVVRTHQPVLLEDVRREPAFLGAIEDVTSEVCVPLFDEGEVVGTLNVESTKGVELTEDDLRLMGALAEHVNVAISRARLYTQVRKSEERFRSLVQNASDVILIMEASGTVRYISPAVERVLGYKPEDVIGKDNVTPVHPDDAAQTQRFITDAVENPGSTSVAELRLQHADGSWRHIESRCTSLLDDPAVGGIVINSRNVTERKQAEVALRRSEERFRSLVQNASDIVTVIGTDGMVQYVSPGIERVLGYRPEDRIGDSAFEPPLVHPDDVAKVRGAFAELFAKGTGSSITDEIRLRHANGSWRYIEAVGKNLVDDPSVGGIVVNYRDITERKEAEEGNAKRARQAELRADVSAALDDGGTLRSILQRCTESMVRNLDAAFARIWILNEEENLLELQASAGMYTHTDGPHSRVPVGRFKVGLIAEERLPHLTNDVVNDPRVNDKEWAEREGMVAFAGYPLVVEGRLVGVAAMFAREALADDTLEALRSMADVIAQGIQRKRAEEELRLRNRAIEASSDGVVITDPNLPDNPMVYVNPAFERMSGHKAEELVGRNCRMLQGSDRDQPALHELRAAVSEGREYRGVLRNYRKDGSLFWNELHIAPVFDREGRLAHFVGVMADVTEKRRAEEEMREANRRLEELATLRADFTAMVAHELDTPLAVVRAYADVLSTGDLGPEEQERALGRIQAETEVLNALVADVRAAATVEREDFTISPSPVPVDDLLKDAATFARTLPGDHPLVTEDAAGGREVWAGPYRIGQVLRNLLSNAAKYSPEGSPIELRAVPASAPGRVRIEVADRGPGVHPDDAERIFEKFGRGRDPAGRKVAGLGLGLYLSQRILRVHGSGLSYYPAPDGGSVFGFELEVAEGAR